MAISRFEVGHNINCQTIKAMIGRGARVSDTLIARDRHHNSYSLIKASCPLGISKPLFSGKAVSSFFPEPKLGLCIT